MVQDALTHTNTCYILSVDALPDASMYKSLYSGVNMPENTTFVARCNMDCIDMAIELGSTNDSAMVLKNEQVLALYEYAVNKLIMHLAPSELLIAHKWQVVHII